MINLVTQSRYISNVIRKIGRQMKTFGKHKKEEGLPRFVQSYQEYLKKAPKDFRRYDRKSKMYIPSIPRFKGRKESDAFQEFLMQTMEYSNTAPTYKELNTIKRNLEQSEFYEDDIDLDDAYEILEEQEAVEKDIEVSTGTNTENRIAAVDDMIKRYDLPKSAKASLRSIANYEIRHGDLNSTYNQLDKVIRNWYPEEYKRRKKMLK